KSIHTRFILQIIATDNGKPAMSDTAKLTITVYAANNFLPGVQSEFFNESKQVNALPDLTDRVPDITRIDSQINYPKTSQAWEGLSSDYKSNFVSRHTGYLYIDTPGIYKLYLNSDDGSKLWVNGELIVDNGKLHAMRERAALMELSQGYHHIRLEYFERTGWAGLILSYSSEHISKRVIPESMLYHTVVQNVHVPAKQSTQLIADIAITDGEEEWLETDYDDEDTWFVEEYSLEDIE
ncbi:PA14 domain protein, partial [Candidatus Magnetomorum sp. HK-1]